MKLKFWKVVGLCVSVFFLIPLVASAEDLEVNPVSWDFGDVEVGTSQSQIITLTSLGPSAVWVYVVEVTPTDNPSGPQICARAPGADPSYPLEEVIPCDFAISSVSEPLPIELPEGATVDVEVTFTPSASGCADSFLYVFSNDSIDPPGMYAFIPISGCGVDTSSPPGELMSELLDFFEASVADASLSGSGPGGSASNRLKAFKNMLKASSDLIEAHEYDLACTQLQDALDRTDGAAPPPDFVAGASMDELASKITEIRTALGCP